MSQFHKDFPFGKGAWIWDLSKCLGGSIPAIIQKCLDNGIKNVFIKTGDAGQVYPGGVCQLTRDITNQFEAAGIRVYSWQFCYGADPIREADVALYSIEQLGVRGVIFDAESAYEELPDPNLAATTMLLEIRKRYPTVFLAHSPYPIIDSHPSFPYLAFGRYCDAVLPQVYFNEWQVSPIDAINRTYQVWLKWEGIWRSSSHGDSIKPLSLVASFYDDDALTPPYTLKPTDITTFISAAAGYKSVSFWSFQHVLRPDCWDAIKNSNVSDPTPDDLDVPNNPSPTIPVASTGSTTTPVTASGQTVTPSATPSSNVTTAPQTTPPADTTTGTKVLVDSVPLPKDGKVVIKSNPSVPGGVSVQVHHKVLIDYIIDFFKSFHKGGVK